MRNSKTSKNTIKLFIFNLLIVGIVFAGFYFMRGTNQIVEVQTLAVNVHTDPRANASVVTQIHQSDKVTINSIGVHRRVCCLEAVTFRLVGDTWSDTSGNYRFDNLDAGTSYIVVSVDHENKYDPVGKAPLYPTRYPS